MIFIFNFNIVYGKYIEKFYVEYTTKIANPILVIESDETVVVENFNENKIKDYKFVIKNFDDTRVNQTEMHYYFELQGIHDNINYKLLNLTTNEIVKFNNGISDKFVLGLERKITEYCFSLEVLESDIQNNTKINLKILTDI